MLAEDRRRDDDRRDHDYREDAEEDLLPGAALTGRGGPNPSVAAVRVEAGRILVVVVLRRLRSGGRTGRPAWRGVPPRRGALRWLREGRSRARLCGRVLGRRPVLRR